MTDSNFHPGLVVITANSVTSLIPYRIGFYVTREITLKALEKNDITNLNFSNMILRLPNHKVQQLNSN